MEATKFLRQTVINPNTGKESERIAVKFDNCKVIRLYFGDATLEETIETIKADRQDALDRVVIRDGEFGEYCVLSRAKTTEEI